MTIEEAIAHAQETADTRSDLCDECRDEHRQLADWLTELKQLRDSFEKQKSINYELVDENQKLINENKELKRLLRLAVDDFEVMGNEVYYKDCDFDFRCKLCPFHCYSGGCSTKWRYTNEVLNLIGDDK